jgi:hypothetical protein
MLIAQRIPGFVMPQNYVFIGALPKIKQPDLAIVGEGRSDPPFDSACLAGFVDAGITHIVAAEALQPALDKALEGYEGFEAMYVATIHDLIPRVFAQLVPVAPA